MTAMDTYLHAYLMGAVTVVALWFYYQLAKIMLERCRVWYQCTKCGAVVESSTGFDRLTELQYVIHRLFRPCANRSRMYH